MEHAENANLCTEMFWIGGDLQQRCGARSKQKRVEDFLIVKGQRRQLVREREDYVHVGDRQQFSSACREPLISRVGLALWAMPVTTGNGELSIMQRILSRVPRRTECEAS
jgi:hypothetical protein